MTRDHAIHNDVISDVTKPHRPRRIEVLNGDERRRRWPDEVRLAIIAEALEPGVVVSHVARRHDLSPSQLFGWLKKLRAEMAAPQEPDAPMFAPAVLDTAPRPVRQESSEAGSIEIVIGRATVRVRGAVDEKVLTTVLQTLKVRA
jgi:transposase